ncbi:MAG: insulinase family protein, partial [Rhodospirillaceae bacterium]|nr:insulinase family protein [Rhodospirillaceae bacterium]
MSVTVTTLPSGLRVVTDRMDSVETVALGAWVNVGTRHETADVNGISHLLEHMAFKGTARRSAQQIAEEMDNVGGHLNAYTSRDHTAYFAKVLKDDAGLATDIIADILLNSSMDPDELEREKQVIVQEISQVNDTPDDIIFDQFQSKAYPDQPMGWPVLGSEKLVRSVSSQQLKSYLNEHYAASDTIIAASGNIDHDAFVKDVERAFAGFRRDAAIKTVTSQYTGGESREERDLEQVHLVLGFPGVPYGDVDYYNVGALSVLMGEGMSSRLFQEIREKRG